MVVLTCEVRIKLYHLVPRQNWWKWVEMWDVVELQLSSCAVILTPQRGEKERLMHERTQLEQNLEETRQSLCGLCKSVSIESGSDQDHSQLLAKLSSPDFPISDLLTPMSSPGLLGKDQDSQTAVDMASCPSECNASGPTANSVQNNPQTEEGGSPQNCPVSLLNACLDMNNNL